MFASQSCIPIFPFLSACLIFFGCAFVCSSCRMFWSTSSGLICLFPFRLAMPVQVRSVLFWSRFLRRLDKFCSSVCLVRRVCAIRHSVNFGFRRVRWWDFGLDIGRLCFFLDTWGELGWGFEDGDMDGVYIGCAAPLCDAFVRLFSSE